MSTAPEPAPTTQWQDRRFCWFKGMFDSHISTGVDYPSEPLRKLWTMNVGDRPKGAGLAMIPSTYCDYDAREHAAQRERGRFIALTGDVDGGNHSLDTIRQGVTDFVTGSAWLIYSSAHARPDDMRWRIIIPLADEQPFEAWHDAQLAFFAFMEARGIAMDHALARAAQPVYLPNVPAEHAKTGTPLRGEDGKPLYFARQGSDKALPGLSLDTGHIAAGIASLRRQRLEDEQLRERIRAEAEAKRASRPRGDNASLIEDFNAANSVATMLEICGYIQSPRNADDWRSPHQTGETYATRVIGSKWVSLSASDAAAGVGEKCSAGCFGDAYDLLVHYKHGGDHKAAFRALHKERRDAQPNVIYPPQFDPPEWMTEAPAYDAIPEWADMGEPVLDLPADMGDITASKPAPGGKALHFEWAGKVEPIIDGFWLIEDWLPKSGIAAVYGHPGSGKSFFTIDIAARVACGEPWAGRHTERGLVLYVIAEGQTGFRNRLFAMQEAGRIARDAPFAFVPTPIDLQSADGDIGALADTLAAACEEAAMPPALVVIDTLSKTFGAGKENTDDMVSYINNCQRIASQFDCLTLIVHHRPKDSESRDLRGHSSLRGNIDTAILIESGPVKTATTLKQKDGEDNVQVRFTLERVIIGEDKRGKEVSTCLLNIVDGEQMGEDLPPEERRKARLTGNYKIALQAVEALVHKHGVEPPIEIPVDAIDRYRTWKAVRAGQVSERLKNEFLATADNSADKKADTAARTARRVVQKLKSLGILGTWGEWVWIN